MSKIFWVSDTHFFHKNALGWRTQFKTVEEMNKFIVKNWEQAVSPDDTVYHLGDEFLGNAKEAQKLLKSLPGYKILIRGNHSTKSDNWYHEAGFAEIHNSLVLTSPSRPSTIRYFINHEPVPYQALRAMDSMKDGGEYNFICIHGHLHDSTDMAFTGEDVWAHPEKYVNVCVEKTNYTPIELFL